MSETRIEKITTSKIKKKDSSGIISFFKNKLWNIFFWQENTSDNIINPKNLQELNWEKIFEWLWETIVNEEELNEIKVKINLQNNLKLVDFWNTINFYNKDWILVSEISKWIFENLIKSKINKWIIKKSSILDISSKLSGDWLYVYFFYNWMSIWTAPNINKVNDSKVKKILKWKNITGWLINDWFDTKINKIEINKIEKKSTEIIENPPEIILKKTEKPLQKEKAKDQDFVTFFGSVIWMDAEELAHDWEPDKIDSYDDWEIFWIGTLKYWEDGCLDLPGFELVRDNKWLDYWKLVFIDKEGNFYGPEEKKEEFLALKNSLKEDWINYDDKWISFDWIIDEWQRIFEIDIQDTSKIMDENGLENMPEEEILELTETVDEEQIWEEELVLSLEEVAEESDEEILELEEVAEKDWLETAEVVFSKEIDLYPMEEIILDPQDIKEIVNEEIIDKTSEGETGVSSIDNTLELKIQIIEENSKHLEVINVSEETSELWTSQESEEILDLEDKVIGEVVELEGVTEEDWFETEEEILDLEDEIIEKDWPGTEEEVLDPEDKITEEVLKLEETWEELVDLSLYIKEKPLLIKNDDTAKLEKIVEDIKSDLNSVNMDDLWIINWTKNPNNPNDDEIINLLNKLELWTENTKNIVKMTTKALSQEDTVINSIWIDIANNKTIPPIKEEQSTQEFVLSYEPIKEKIFINSLLTSTKQSTNKILENEAKKRFQEKLRNSWKFKKFSLKLIEKKYLKSTIKKLNKETKGVFDTSFLETKNIASNRIYKDRNEFLDTTIKKLWELINTNINMLSEDYLNWKIPNEQLFWKKFEEIISSEKDLKTARKIKKLDHKWTNILFLLNIEKEYRTLLKNVKNITNSNSEDIDWEIFELFKTFANSPEKLMFFVENSNIHLNEKNYENPTQNDDEFEERAVKYLKQTCYNTREIEVKFDILDSWKWAFQMIHNDRKNWIQYNIWKSIDNHPIISILGISLWLFFTWVATWNINHPSFLDNEIINYILSTTKISSLSTLTFGSIWFGLLNYFKSFANYTDKQEEFEKNIVHWNENSLKTELEDIRNKLSRSSNEKKSFWRKKFYSWREKNTTKELEKYEWKKNKNDEILSTPTHADFVDIEILIDEIKKLLANHMTSEEINEEDLQDLITEAIVRIELWKETWHSFLKCNEEDVAEQKQLELYNLILIWLNKIGTNYSDFVNWSLLYLKTKNKLTKSYEKSSKSFRSIRTQESLKKWALSAWVFAISNIIGQYLSHSWQLTKEISSNIIIKPNTPSSDIINIDNADIMNLLKDNKINLSDKVAITNFLNDHWFKISWNEIYQTINSSHIQTSIDFTYKLKPILWDNYEKFINSIKDTQSHSTLWEILTKDVFGNVKLWNDVKNQILELISNWTNNDLFISLTNEAARNGLFDILNNKAKIVKISKSMARWWYNIKRDWIINKISTLQSWALDFNNMNTQEKRKLLEVIWTFVSKNNWWNEALSNVFVNTTTWIIKDSVTKKVGNIVL